MGAFSAGALVAYKMDFDRSVLERELLRHHHGDAAAADDWLTGCRWEDAMVPYAVWRGVWSVKRGVYRNQPLGRPHVAVADCELLPAKLEQVTRTGPAPCW
ncbi:hypothetical protein [Streptomyces sp. NRRL S-813]|uniref:hypothetical protein n=1 Tax=Streptomyces sp. NRRL S-813 TaxID=1463919 RepID=UPI0004BE67E8|nr:hypothetical protein [Streptomyces sp. NRRL S-813]